MKWPTRRLVMFPIVTPDALDLEYQIELSDTDTALLGLENTEDAVVAIPVCKDEIVFPLLEPERSEILASAIRQVNFLLHMCCAKPKTAAPYPG